MKDDQGRPLVLPKFLSPHEPAKLRWSKSHPHLEQAGAATFVTWCLRDAVPRDFFRTLYRKRIAWLNRPGVPVTDKPRDGLLNALPWQLRQEYYRLFVQPVQVALDECHGSCILRDPTLRAVVDGTILYYDDQRYTVYDYVVMPNHVHVLMATRGEGLLDHVRRWKRYTARSINKLLGRQGRLWHRDCFDHIVRSAGYFLKYRRYIADNPRRAGLAPGEYSHYTRKLPYPYDALNLKPEP